MLLLYLWGKFIAAFSHLQGLSSTTNQLDNNDLQYDASNTPVPGCYGVADIMDPSNICPSEQMLLMNGLSPALTDSIAANLWDADSLDVTWRHPSPVADSMACLQNAAVHAPITSQTLMSTSALGPEPCLPGRSSAEEPRFDGIEQHVAAAGMETLNDSSVAFFGDSFRETTPPANKQNCGQHKEPAAKVVSDLAQPWNCWEHIGFGEPFLSAVESMLISESSRGRNSVLAQVKPLIDTSDGKMPPITAGFLSRLLHGVQHELPTAWSLAMALSVDRHSWQCDRPRTTLASILMSQLSGLIPKEQLLQLIGACL
ncbi:hypothetical protein RJ55_01580 [Drechmeria coniospora]|nr:hypothetical protein RJ55_01580 [Drechmeria coniospora]